jgi:hypothetical protein
MIAHAWPVFPMNVGCQSNGISAIPRLFELLALKGGIVEPRNGS